MILNIGKRFPQVTFVIAGATNSLGATDYLAHLSALIEAKGIKNVHLMENVPIEELVALYGRAKIYLHAMVAEDFGVSVVEAMAAGLIPVVHRSGGVWEDVLQRGKFGFGYSDFNESLRCIETALASADDGRAALVEHAKAFDKKIFGRELALVLGETRRDRIEAQA
jgi:glycosyltransferase involved in cell wall biosynthesis